jgi:Tol biopolymer transport system component
MRKSIVGMLTLTALAAAAAVAPAYATYPGKVGRIAFAVTGPGGSANIYSAASDGSSPKALTKDTSFDACPSFSANGRLIAFCSNRAGEKGMFQIWVMTADGGSMRQISKSRHGALFPDFSPDGRRIAYQANEDQTPAQDDIYVVPARGGKAVRFTGAPGNDDYPAFSPDGKTIAFVSHRKGIGQIWLMDARDGRHQRQLTRDSADKDQVPDWSPDGKRIAYEAAGDIWVMNADGTDPQNLTHDGKSQFGPAWSPDGTQIAYVNLAAQKRIYVMSADGTNKHPLGGTGSQLVPAWQPTR